VQGNEHLQEEDIDKRTVYTMDNQSLDSVPFITDLGVTVSNDLSWSRHIESIMANVNKTLGLVKRGCKEIPDLKVRKLLDCALVRPNINLSTPVICGHRIQLSIVP
jgi:hypothetical protein